MCFGHFRHSLIAKPAKKKLKVTETVKYIHRKIRFKLDTTQPYYASGTMGTETNASLFIPCVTQNKTLFLESVNFCFFQVSFVSLSC